VDITNLLIRSKFPAYKLAYAETIRRMRMRIKEIGPYYPHMKDIRKNNKYESTKARITLAWAVCKATAVLSRKDHMREAARGASLFAIVDVIRLRNSKVIGA